MKNMILSKAIEDSRNNATISNSHEEHHTSIDNISDEIIDEHVFDFLDAVDFDEYSFSELVADMKNTDVKTLLCSYYLLMTIPEGMFLDCAEFFYDSHIIEVMRLVCMWYYSEEFFMLANNLSIDTSDIIEMHKLQNKVVDSVWYLLMLFFDSVIYEAELVDFFYENPYPDEIKNQLPDRVQRFLTLSLHFHASEYEPIFNNDRIKEDF